MKARNQIIVRVLATTALALVGPSCLTEFPAGPDDLDAQSAVGLDAEQPNDDGPRAAADARVGDAARRPDGAAADFGELDAVAFGDGALPGDAARLDAAAVLDGAPPDAALPADAATPVDAAPVQVDADLVDADLVDADLVDADLADAAPCEAQEEICDGVDNDCDAQIDEGSVCGEYVASRCEVWLGQADVTPQPIDTDTWGDCPAAERDTDGPVRCVATRADGAFRSFRVRGDMNADDQLAVAFRCTDVERPAFASWVQSHCVVALGHSDLDDPGDGTGDWSGCLPAVHGEAGNRACVTSGLDGRFHALQLRGNVNDDDHLGVAFVCVDGEQPERARSLATQTEVFIGLKYSFVDWVNDWNGLQEWSRCPQSSLDEAGDTRCVGSQGDQVFHSFELVSVFRNVAEPSVLAIALKSR